MIRGIEASNRESNNSLAGGRRRRRDPRCTKLVEGNAGAATTIASRADASVAVTRVGRPPHSAHPQSCPPSCGSPPQRALHPPRSHVEHSRRAALSARRQCRRLTSAPCHHPRSRWVHSAEGQFRAVAAVEQTELIIICGTVSWASSLVSPWRRLLQPITFSRSTSLRRLRCRLA